MSDKRTVSTDALETLGTIIGPNEKRDAIHLAVIPAVAGIGLKRSQHVKLIDGKAYGASGMDDGLGIVDPFLQSTVKEGQHFWLVIYPRVITSLRHVWTHPDLPDEVGARPATPDKSVSEQWLRGWCNTSDITYEELIEVSTAGRVEATEDMGYDYGARWTLEGGCLLSLGSDAGGVIQPEVWDHVRIVIGREPTGGRAEYFSCSC